jgi:hypothetical protein
MNTAIQLPKERVDLLAPADLEDYLLGHGWHEDGSGSAVHVGKFRYDADPEVAVLVPRDRAFVDYAVRVGDVLQTLAVLERRPIWEILEALLAQRSRVVANGPAVRPPKATDSPSASRGKKDPS